MNKLIALLFSAIVLVTVPASADCSGSNCGPNVDNSSRRCWKDCYTNSNGVWVCHTTCS